jgi:hypothetical protein
VTQPFLFHRAQNFIVAVASLTVLATGSTHASEKARAVEISRHGDWQTRMIDGGDRTLVFRALTSKESGKAFMLLMTDRVTPACTPQTLHIRAIVKDRAGFSKEVFGQMRIDSFPTRNALFAIKQDKGDAFLQISLKRWDNKASFTPELMKGNVIRFKLTENSKDYYFKFSLDGFSAAWKESKKLCEMGRSVSSSADDEQSDAEFFK